MTKKRATSLRFEYGPQCITTPTLAISMILIRTISGFKVLLNFFSEETIFSRNIFFPSFVKLWQYLSVRILRSCRRNEMNLLAKRRRWQMDDVGMVNDCGIVLFSSIWFLRAVSTPEKIFEWIFSRLRLFSHGSERHAAAPVSVIGSF